MPTKDRTYHETLHRHGADILASENMQLEKTFMQHGGTSVYAHSVAVTLMALKIARTLPVHVCEQSLVRGSLLHDYFLYDWHDRASSKPRHATRHARYALENAERDFALNHIERDMIAHHMFPLTPPPRHTEGWILTIADKAVAARETLARNPKRRRA